MRHLACLLVLTWVVGCGDDRSPSSTMRAYPSPPSSALLCGLVPHESTSADVRRVLGPPDTDQTATDGIATWLYYYDAQSGPNTPIAVVQFWFTSDTRFESATVFNVTMPPCWATDGGS